MSLHPRVARALEEIDSSVFNSDQFYSPESRKLLKMYLERWTKKLEEEVPALEEDSDDDEEAQDEG